MKPIFVAAVAAVAAAAAALGGCTGSQTKTGTPPVGVAEKRAPDFTLNDTEGKPVALHDLLAQGPVILAFFPKAFTGG